MTNPNSNTLEFLKLDPVYAALAAVVEKFKLQYPALGFGVSKILTGRKHTKGIKDSQGKIMVLGPQYCIDVPKPLFEDSGFNAHLIQKINPAFLHHIVSAIPDEDKYCLEEFEYMDIRYAPNASQDDFGELNLRKISTHTSVVTGWNFTPPERDGRWDFVLTLIREDAYTHYRQTDQEVYLMDTPEISEENKNDDYHIVIFSGSVSKLIFRIMIPFESVI